MKKIRLFCIPYAGGSAVVYSKWKDDLDKCVHLHPVELAGKGRRIADPLYESAQEAAEDVIKIIKPELKNTPYAFYGHSLGALIAYLAAQTLREMRYPGPSHIFFSGRGAPHIRRDDKPVYHTLPENEFREKIIELGGTPPDFFKIPALMEILLPTLRRDFKISWNYFHSPETKPLDCDITVLTGKEEDLKPEQIDEWKLHTNCNCTFHSFEGGHFFLNAPTCKEKLMGIINDTLVPIAMRRIVATA
jgi:medium-chain acyl-[acyl-carrier-protein] hydrolase